MPSPKPCCERDHDRDGNCDRHPPSELPAVQAEVQVPPESYQAMHRRAQKTEAELATAKRLAAEVHEAVAFWWRSWTGVAHDRDMAWRMIGRLVDATPEKYRVTTNTCHPKAMCAEAAENALAGAIAAMSGESPSAPTKFPMCAVHSFVTTDVCGCARRDVPSAPTHAGEMPEWMTELIESAQIRADTFRSNGLGKWAGQLEDCIAKAKAHYDHPKPTGMTREVEELVAMCEKMADDPLRMVDQISLREKIAAVRAAGGGA